MSINKKKNLNTFFLHYSLVLLFFSYFFIWDCLVGRDGLTHNMLNEIHNHWKYAEAVRIKCLGVPTIDMKNVCTQIEVSCFVFFLPFLQLKTPLNQNFMRVYFLCTAYLQ